MEKTQKKKMEWNQIEEIKNSQFSLFQEKTKTNLWEVSWRKSKLDWGRRRFKANSLSEALQKAPIIAGLVKVNVNNNQTFTILKAFDIALSNSKREKDSGSWDDWHYAVKRFIAWLNQTYPERQYWHLLSRDIIREYLKTYDGKSANTKRLMLQPIIQTSGFMSRDYDLKDIATKLGIGSKLKTTPKQVFLEDVIEFCDYVARENPRLEVGVALQGLAGLQLQEVTRLTWDKVDLQQGLIKISGVVKNEYRERVIPIFSRVEEALRRAKGLQIKVVTGRIIDLNDTVIKNRCGGAYGENWENYSKEMKKELKQWNPQIDWKPKDLRNCILTFADINGLKNDLWKQYVGQAPNDLISRHYIGKFTSLTPGQKQESERQMNLFRIGVIEPIEQAIENGLTAQIINVL